MRTILIAIFLILGGSCLTAQPGLGPAFEGKHFYVGFMQNEIPDFETLLLELLIVSTYPADIVVKVQNEPDRIYNTGSNSIIKVDLNPSLELTQSELVTNETVEIISNVPILVYVFNSQVTTSACFTAVPVWQWGYEYVVMSYPNDQYLASFDYYGRLDSTKLIPRKSEFLVIASENNTDVVIIPKSDTELHRSENQPFNITLNQGESYLVQSDDYGIDRGDLTGSIVRSNKPIGVISGHVRTAIPHYMDRIFESKDHLAVMLTPTSAWGRQFFSVPFEMHQGGDMFRITGIYPNTIVQVETEDTTMVFSLDAPGSFKQLAEFKKPAKWTSSNPIQIGQYMMRIGGDEDNLNYDPDLVILPPAEQFVKSMIFQTVGNEAVNPFQFDAYKVCIITELEGLNTLKLDDKFVLGLDPNILNNQFPNTSQRWTKLLLTPGVHTITCESGSFSGIAYGYGKADSYSLTLGSSLVNPYIKDTLPPLDFEDENCGRISGTITEVADSNSSGLLLAVMSDKSYNYSFELSPGISDSTYSTTFSAHPIDYMKPGRFIMEYRDKNGYGGNYRFQYMGVGFDAPGTVSYGVVKKGDTVCYDYSVVSNGVLPVHLDSVMLRGIADNRFEFIQKTFTPVTLYYGDRYDFRICFHPDSNFQDINQKIFYYFDCDRFDSTIIMGEVQYPALTVTGYDFGDVCLGDTSYGKIFLINEGNVDAVFDSINNIIQDSQFEIDLFDIDTLAFLPVILNAGDTISIPAKFIPRKTGDALRKLYAKNNLNIVNEINLTGRGIAPLINSIAVDWGKRRIGSDNDTVVYLHNIGDCDTKVLFNGLDGNTLAFMTDSLSTIKSFIRLKDSLGLFMSFKPNAEVAYRLESFFIVNSPNHDLVIADMNGKGIIPAIVPFNVEFDTLDIYSYKDSIAAIIFSNGSERLWLNLKSIIGDDSCFIINDGDLSILTDKYLEPDSTLFVPIRFNPKKLDLSKIELVFTHDAFPAFNRGDTSIFITGYARKVDTLTPVISFESNLKYQPCNSGIFPVYISNSGNVDLSLDTLLILDIALSAVWVDGNGLPMTTVLPLKIKPDSILKLNLKIIPRANEAGTVQLYAVFNDTIQYFSEKINIEQLIYPLTINIPESTDYTIGDTASMTLSGTIPHKSELPVEFDLDLFIAHKYIHIIKNTCELELTYKDTTVLIPIILSQYDDRIHAYAPSGIYVSDSCQWSVRLSFLTLLGDSQVTELKVRVQSDLCYMGDEKIFSAGFTGVCSFDLSHIKFKERVEPDVEIYPNPATEELCIKINLMFDDMINISIFDQIGKKILNKDNLNLKKGIHSLIFEISPMSSGVYIMSVQTTFNKKNKMFIITK